LDPEPICGLAPNFRLLRAFFEIIVAIATDLERKSMTMKDAIPV